MLNRENDRDNIAWDIETTGFSAADEITVSGFWFPDRRAHVILNAKQSISEIETVRRVKQETDPDLDLELTVTNSEAELLQEMQEIVFHSIDKDYNRLIAYNGEIWRGGFDLPFLRRRCIHHEIGWIFKGLQYADLYETIKKRINTTVFSSDGERTDNNDLVGSYEVLFDADEWDPYQDSEQAVKDYERGRFTLLLAHNIADIRRTWELGEVVRKYVSPKDIKTKKL
ncbi:hypothetical protein RBH26_20910 [Natronolimnohabitans sp. A-GB9]|uniref:hypothetical protein n=1 Tax=Natronolimnohabitans sp. A-GB9 TaxID=3069757 RepID=UPI0027B4E9EF|nr:hypothetical protein [Natronolimnohabitans sp. A-GB9]MDQ2052906.1 hypothetical protein [Natronolimnohabitans sp. A-GB9]